MRGALHSQFSGAIWNYGTLEMHACSLTANRGHGEPLSLHEIHHVDFVQLAAR